MGMNLRSCCHKCREQIFHFRGEEQKTIDACPKYVLCTEMFQADRSKGIPYEVDPAVKISDLKHCFEVAITKERKHEVR